MTTHSIGALARRTDTKVQTIRYYEQIGLLSAPARTAGNQRVYRDADVERLAFIRHARALGFSLDDVRALLRLSDEPDRPCDQVDALARDHLADVEARIASLTALKAELERMIEQCRGGQVAECRILSVIADHRLCKTEHGYVGAPRYGRFAAYSRSQARLTSFPHSEQVARSAPGQRPLTGRGRRNSRRPALTASG
jgi:Cu(I)-responsive transcriptional regulator